MSRFSVTVLVDVEHHRLLGDTKLHLVGYRSKDKNTKA